MAYASSDFYWKDWEAEPTLRKASYAAQGVWMRMLAVMHRATPRGFFLDETGERPTGDDLHALFGKPADETEALISELIARKVCDVIDGVPVCRKMKKQSEKSPKRSGEILPGQTALDVAGKLAQRRVKDAERKRAARAKAKTSADISDAVTGQSADMSADASMGQLLNFPAKLDSVRDPPPRDARPPSSFPLQDSSSSDASRSTMPAACHPDGRQPASAGDCSPPATATRRTAAIAAAPEPTRAPSESEAAFAERHERWRRAQAAA